MSLIVCGSQYAALLNVKALLKDRSSFFQSRCAPHLQGAGTGFAVASYALAAAKEMAQGVKYSTHAPHVRIGDCYLKKGVWTERSSPLRPTPESNRLLKIDNFELDEKI